MSRRLFGLLAAVYLVVGAVAGLLLGWAWQIGSGGCSLDEMSARYWQEYLGCVAVAHPASKAEARCAFPALGDDEIAALAEQAAAENMLGAGGDRETGLALVTLASMFGRQRPDLLVYAATLEALSQGPSEDSTPPSVPQIIQGPGESGFLFAVTRLQATCEQGLKDHVVQVRVLEPGGGGLAGQRVRIEWQGGQQDAVTGVKEVGLPGYADFRLTPGASYRLYLLGAGDEQLSRAVELSVAAAGCSDSERARWLLDFTRYDIRQTAPSP